MAEYRISRPLTSVAWRHFEIKDSEQYTATCNHCEETFSYRSSVSNLLKHLQNKHNFKNDDGDSDGDDKRTIKSKLKPLKSEVWEYFEVKDNEAKLATCNLCSEQFSYRTTSANLRKHLERSHSIVLGCDGAKTEEEDMVVEKLDSDDDGAGKVETTYTEVRRQRSSVAWEHFTIHNDVTKVASCNLCGTLCSYRTSVSNLMKHVRRKHNISGRSDEEYDESDVEAQNMSSTRSSIMRAHRSIVWLYFKCVDPESKVSECLICNKLLCHSTTLTNLKKHLVRKHPNVRIPATRQDGSKRIFISSGGKLYEVDDDAKGDIDDIDNNQNDTVEMDTIYLDDFDAIDQEPAANKSALPKTAPKKRKRASNAYDTSSDEEVTFVNKYAAKQFDSLDYFGKYIASLLKQLPNQISNQLQTDFVKQIMNAQLTYETQKSQVTKVTDTESNAYSITITAQDNETEQVPKKDVLETLEKSDVNDFALENVN